MTDESSNRHRSSLTRAWTSHRSGQQAPIPTSISATGIWSRSARPRAVRCARSWADSAWRPDPARRSDVLGISVAVVAVVLSRALSV